MSPQSSDLRNQAAKCLLYASAITEAVDDLRKMAAAYIAEAEAFEADVIPTLGPPVR